MRSTHVLAAACGLGLVATGVAAALNWTGGGEEKEAAAAAPATTPTTTPTTTTTSTTTLVSAAAPRQADQGQMVTREGKRTVDLPLEHTRVELKVSAHLVDATVVQRFHNPYDHPIEAVYLFPLPTGAAVSALAIHHGGHTVRGTIHRRDEATAIYRQARDRGQLAALLTEERPNLFTQAVANIAPGDRVEVELRYQESLALRDGAYQIVFPMVAPPRYLPGGAHDDAVQAPRLPPEVRSAHDIDVAVDLDAGVPLRALDSPSHAILVARDPAAPRRATVRLHPADTIPNRDFVLRYQVAGDDPEVAVLAHRAGAGPGSFLLVAQPPAAVADADAAPRELIFVIDTSSSMAGAPLATATALIRRVLGGLRPDDTFQIVRFADTAAALGPGPLAARPRNVQYSLDWLDHLRAGGGTEMTAGIAGALAVPHDPARLRIVAFLTDGYIGNEDQILALVGDKMGASRLFALGVGSAVNRYLLEEMARAGRGAVQVVTPGDDPAAAAARFAERIDRAALTDISIDWNGLAIADATPAAVPDLFAGEPLVIAGHYGAPGAATITVHARRAGRAVSFAVPVELPAAADHPAIAALWARRRIADLERALIRRPDPAAIAQITELGLSHGLVTRYTAFVAVDDQAPAVTGRAQRVVVPVEVPAAAAQIAASGGGGTGYGSIGVGSYGSVGYGSGSAAGYGYGGGGGGMMAARAVAAPQVRIGNAVAVGGLDKQIVRRYVRARLPAIRYCYEKQLLVHPDLRGTVNAHFTIDATGAVTVATADGLGNTAVEECVARAVKTIRFPAATGGGIVRVTYPFLLEPEEE